MGVDNIIQFAQGKRFEVTEINCPNCNKNFLCIDRFNESGVVYVCRSCGYQEVKEDK